MTENPPTVSILIPTYNQRPEFLRAALQSVFAQTYTDFEVVVSDNHSTNDVPQVLAEFTDHRLRVIKPPEHLALVPNFQFVGEGARGRYLSFLPSDDVVEPDWLATLVPLLEASPASVIAFGEVAGVKHDDLHAVIYTNRNNAYPAGEHSALDIWKLIMPFGRPTGWLVGGLIRADAYYAVDGIAQAGFHFCVDYTLLIKLLGHGGAVYANQLVGRHRVWGVRDGKTDGNRSLRAIHDVCNLYDMVEASPSYQSHAAHLSADLAAAKVNKGKLLSLLLIQGRANGKVSDAEHAVAAEKILSMHDSLMTRGLTATAGFKPAMWLVDRFYGVCTAIYRHLLGPRYNSGITR